MRFSISRIIATLILAIGLSGPAMAGPFQDGVEAYTRGDYRSALIYWQPLADQGDPGAQRRIGSMYETGQGVKQDYAAALKWYRLAADQGDSRAQASLGLMYRDGHGLPQDNIQAYKWSHIAARAGLPIAAEARDELARRMDAAQIDVAQKQAIAWKPAPVSWWASVKRMLGLASAE